MSKSESVTTERFALLFNDGSLNVSSEGKDLNKARKLLDWKNNEGDAEMVKVEINLKKLIEEVHA